MVRERKPWTRLIALTAVLALTAAACGSDDDDGDGGGAGGGGDSADGVLTIGSILPQTGDLSDFGPGMQAGVDLAIEDIEASDLLGFDIVGEPADSGTDPDIANTATERLVNTEQVDAIIGAAGSTVSLLGVIEPTIGAGRIQCSPSNTAPQFTTYDDDGLYFRTAPSDKFQSQLLADAIAADGHSRVAIVNRADDYGQAFADLTRQEIEARDGEVVVEVAADPEGTNFDADVAQVADPDAAPDATVVIAFPDEGAPIIDAMIEQGVGPSDIPMYVTDGLASDDLATSIDPGDPTVIDGVQGTRPGSGVDTSEFDQRLSDEKGVETVTFAAQSYDCVIAIALAAKAAGSDDPALIVEEMIEVTRDGTACATFAECAELLDDGEDIDYEGITAFDFDDTGEPAEGTYELFEYVDGSISTIETRTITS